jgi:outer membrane murein-binding lipoprotein Lpp
MNPGQITLGRPLSRLLIASAIAVAFPAYADNTAEIEKLKAQIEELGQKLKVLGRKQELMNEDVAAKQKAAPTVTASERGFGFKAQDGQFEYRLRGIVYADYRQFDGDAFPTAVDGFLARRIRPTFEGTVFGKYGFRFTPEFGEATTTSSPTIIDAYLDIREKPELQVRIGKHKPFVGLERLQSASDIKLIERSFVSNNILPNRDFGVSVSGDVLEKRLNYAVGVFNGVQDGANIGTNQDAYSKKHLLAGYSPRHLSMTPRAHCAASASVLLVPREISVRSSVAIRPRNKRIISSLAPPAPPPTVYKIGGLRKRITTTARLVWCMNMRGLISLSRTVTTQLLSKTPHGSWQGLGC